LINLNLLPKRYRKRTLPSAWRLATFVAGILVLGSVGFVHYQTQASINRLENQKEQLRLEVELLRSYIAEQNKLQQKQRELEALASVSRQVRAKFRPWADYLARFLVELPSKEGRLEVRLETLSVKAIDPNKAKQIYGIPADVEFTFRGRAASRNVLVQMVKTFETDPGFGIDFQKAEHDLKTGIYRFSASVGMIAKVENEAAR